MRCGECGAENAAGRRFCGGCGAPLSLGCAQCGFVNQADARFCGGCGRPLAAPAPAAPGAAAAAGSTASERRQVTILFADLADFTGLATRLDAEDLHGLVEQFFQAADAVVRRYGGTVDKHMGDAVMALFGAPVAHGDDPMRALRAAFGIHAAVAALAEATSQPMRVHIGIASGEVVVTGGGADGRRDYTVLGESVNLAARLEKLARPGETLLSDSVYRAVAGAVACEAMGEVAVKGLHRPVRAWRAQALRDAPAASGRSPFVGRRNELRQFAGLLEMCREGGTGQAVLLRGEAGIGKSRLVEEFARRAESEGFVQHKALVLDFGMGEGQEPTRALVRSLLGLSGSADKARRAAVAEETAEREQLEPSERAFLNDLLDLPQPTELRAIYDAMDNTARSRGERELVGRLIRTASARQPRLLVVEDLHWADPPTLAHLANIACVIRDCRAVLVMTTRVEGDPLDAAWRVATRGSSLLTLDLGPLRRDEALAMIGGLAEVTARAAQDCLERAEGNPLFLEQLLRNAEESGQETVPASIQSLVLARMDRLPSKDRQALQAASVAGQRFSVEALRYLIDDPDYSCASLVEAWLVRPEGGGYLFAHALIQEGVYASLLKKRKRELHRRAAEWFAGRDAALYAEHLDRARDPRAAQAYLEAAQQQAATYHHERALVLVERGLALAETAAEKWALTRLQGEIALSLGSIAEAIAAFRSALELAADDTERCRAWIGLAAGMRISDQLDEAFAVLDLAEPAARAGGLLAELSQVHHLRGNLYFPLGRIEECRSEHVRALEAARQAGSAEAEALALSGLADVDYAGGRMASAFEHFNQCVELARRHGLGRIEVANRSMIGFSRYYLCELREALEDGRTAAAAAARVEHHRAEMLAEVLVGIVFIDMAELARAEEHLDRVGVLARRLGAKRFVAQNMFYRSQMLCEAGRREEALRLLEECLPISREFGFRFSGGSILGGIVRLSPDPEVRGKAVAEARELFRQGAVSHTHFWFYRNAIEGALERGEWDEAEGYTQLLEDYARAQPLPWTRLMIARARALADFGRGRHGPALAKKLARVRAEAERVGLLSAVPLLDRALAGMRRAGAAGAS